MSIKTSFIREAAAPVAEAPTASEPIAIEKNYTYGEPLESTEPQNPKAEEAPNDKPQTTNEEPVVPSKSQPSHEAADNKKQQPEEQKSDESQPPAATTYDWKKEVKKLSKADVLKELGLDEFAVGMVDYYQKEGNVTPYLEVKTVDYSKMTSEQLLEMQLKKENPGMSETALKFKLRKELEQKYYLNRDDFDEDSDEAVYGQEQMRLDADKIRKQLIEEQEKFKVPVKDTDAIEQREAERLQTLQKAVTEHKETVDFLQQKALRFGEGDEAFTFPIDNADAVVESCLNTILNTDRQDIDGVELTDFYKKIAVTAHLPQFLDAYGKHREAIAKKAFEAELENATPRQQQQPLPPSDNNDYGYRG